MLAKESVNVSVDRQKIIEGDSIILTVKANNFNTEPELTLPKLDWFTVANGPSQSSSTNVQFINGQMKKLQLPIMDLDTMKSIRDEVLNEHQLKRFDEKLEIDFSAALEGKGRFRVNFFNQINGLSAVFRTIPSVGYLANILPSLQS